MSAQALNLTSSLENLVAEICLSRKITRQDQSRLMTLGSQLGLSDYQVTLLGQVYELLRQGRIRVVD